MLLHVDNGEVTRTIKTCGGFFCIHVDDYLITKTVCFYIQVGWIFTDLLSEDTRIGTVRYTRNKARLQISKTYRKQTLIAS